MFYMMMLLILLRQCLTRKLVDHTHHSSTGRRSCIWNGASKYQCAAMVMYALLPKQAKMGTSHKLMLFYSMLPQKFERKEANEVGRSIGIKERTVGSLIPELRNEGLIVGENGKFEKVAAQ
jgi:hypothetical protein